LIVAAPNPGAPANAGGRLYLRENDVLLCYDILADSAWPTSPATADDYPIASSCAENKRKFFRASAPRQGARPRCPVRTDPQEVVEKMLELAKTGKKDLVYDLGSGDGRIVIAAAKKCGCKGWYISQVTAWPEA
jgi:hypothetical protein